MSGKNSFKTRLEAAALSDILDLFQWSGKFEFHQGKVREFLKVMSVATVPRRFEKSGF